MEKTEVLPFEVVVKPGEIATGVDMSRHLGLLVSERYKGTIYRGVVILQVVSVRLTRDAKVLTSGDVKFYADVTCRVLAVSVGDTVRVTVTSTNNMGAFWKSSAMTIFIPRQLSDDDVPQQDASVEVEIVGKRVSDKIVCIGKLTSAA